MGGRFWRGMGLDLENIYIEIILKWMGKVFVGNAAPS